ncbi:MAG: VWA domain-containing protein [Acidobacteria bacterium]|nr:VWA domain-containing protein [Acidobacteriota bacterium]
MQRHTSAVLFAVLLSVSLRASSQDSYCPPGEGSELRRVIPVNVLDRDSNQVTGLTAADFRGKYRGHPVKILSATWDTRPRRIVLVLDVSESMVRWSPARWATARAAARDILSRAPAEYEVALILFAKKVADPIPLQRSRAPVLQQLTAAVENPQKLEQELGGSTAFLDALLEAARLLDPPQVGDVIYAITDGGDNRSQTSEKKLRELLVGSGTRLYTLVFLDPNRRDLGAEYALFEPSLVREFVEVTGGHMAMAMPERENGAIGAPFGLYAQMAAFYRVEVELPEPVDKARSWKLEVVDAEGKRRQGLTLVYPNKLVPCPASESSPTRGEDQ